MSIDIEKLKADGQRMMLRQVVASYCKQIAVLVSQPECPEYSTREEWDTMMQNLDNLKADANAVHHLERHLTTGPVPAMSRLRQGR